MTPPIPVSTRPDVTGWLEAFALAVRERDHSGARDLFAPDAEGFGTVAERYTGLDQLVAEQWRDVWGRTAGFAFDVDTATCWAGGDLVVVISEWSSTGLEDPPRHRAGRATFGLAHEGDDLVAVHSHFSMAPGTLA